MQYIYLKSGDRVLVDDEDYSYLSQFKWYLNNRGGYAIRNFYLNGFSTTRLMHREIMGYPKGMYVDHKNHNILDNRRQNYVFVLLHRAHII